LSAIPPVDRSRYRLAAAHPQPGTNSGYGTDSSWVLRGYGRVTRFRWFVSCDPPSEQFSFFVVPVTIPRPAVSASAAYKVFLSRQQPGEAQLRKRVLLTGGEGFLSSHLCPRQLSQECEVLCVAGTRRKIEPLIGVPAFEIMSHDVTFPLYVEVDEIYNLACPASLIHY
jgi:hypothetical protein